MRALQRKQAMELLADNNLPQNVIEHCLTVSGNALEIANKIKAAGHELDTEFIEAAALLHDIGRAKTHGIRHGIEGAKILKDYPSYARVCETHIGGGIKKEEAEELGLPPKDYIPETLEEKIICYADKITHETQKTTLDETIKKFTQRLGENHPTIKRIKKLDKEIQELIND